MPISTNYYLDTRASKKKQSPSNTSVYPIKLTITKNRRAAYISTGIFVRKDQWKNNRVIGRCDKVQLNNFLDSFLYHARSIINEGRLSGRYLDWTVLDIKNELASIIENGKVEETKPSLCEVYNKFAESRTSERTKEIYRVTWRKIASMYPSAEAITLSSIDLGWLEEFDERLIARGNNPSTRNLDLRNLRAVIKYAYKHKLLPEYPFEDFKMPDSLSPERYLTKKQLRAFMHATLKPWEEKYRDFFMLSFYLIGINTEDLLHVKTIEENRITYSRSKTGKIISVKVEAEALSIINRHRGQHFLLNILDTYKNTHNWTSKVDSVLQDIARRIGIPPITMYWARHTWATLAQGDLGIDIGIISDALGHQNNNKKTTWIYIHKRDYSKVDSANRKVIDYVLNKK